MIMNGRLQRQMSWPTRLAVVLCGFFVLPLTLFPNPENEAAHLSPFTAVVCKGDDADVEFEGRRYELVSIDGLPTKEMIDYCKEKYGKLWEKRFSEDLVSVLDGMGHSPGTSVKLVLRNAQTQTEYVVPRATMTAENRQAVWRARNRNLRISAVGESQADKRSPFTAVACEGDEARVEFEGRHYELVSIDGLVTKGIVDYCKQTDARGRCA